MVNWEKRVTHLTEVVRSSADPVDRRIRELILQHGIDVQESLIVNIVQDGRCLETGVLVTPDRHVIEFEYSHRDTSPDQERFRVWKDITDSYHQRTFAPGVEAALRFLANKADVLAG